nr:hypothetical protein [Tanacetum cinerariifolium]
MVPYEAFACGCGAGDVVLRESYKPKTREERVRLLTSSPKASSTLSYSLGPSTPPSYSPGSSTPQSYSSRSSRNAECSNYKHLLDKITRGFLSQKGSGMERDVKEKSLNMSKTNTGIGLFTASNDTCNEACPVGDTSTVMKGVTPSMIHMTVEKDKLSSLEDTTVLGSFSPLPSQKVNVRTLFTPGGNRIDVVVPVDSIRAISERFSFFLGKKAAYPVVANYKWHPNENLLKEDVSIVLVWVKLNGVLVTAFSKDGLSAIATKLGTPLMIDSYTSHMCMQSWGSSSYARVMIELRADVELKDNIVVAMPKITREGLYTCNVHVKYDWKPPKCSSCKVFRHIHKECPKNTGAGEKKIVKKPSQISRGVLVGLKMGFKPHKEYRHVPKKSTASSSCNKKKGKGPTIEVSNSNPFDALNSIDNDVEFGTNGRTTNFVNNGATLSGSSFMKVDNSSSDGNPLKKVEFLKEDDSEDEVASVDNDMARSVTYERDFGTQSLLEQ